jgi:hypothetical protein
VADEILVDLMFAACGITYAEAVSQGGIESHDLQGVAIPFASAQLLWKMKQTVRDKDVADRAWLRAKLGLQEPPPPSTVTIPRWLWLGLLAFAGVLTLAWVVAWIRGFQFPPPNP